MRREPTTTNEYMAIVSDGRRTALAPQRRGIA